MAKTTRPKSEDDVLLQMGRKKPLLHLYWLQVDRQTKASYETLQRQRRQQRRFKLRTPYCRWASMMRRKARSRSSRTISLCCRSNVSNSCRQGDRHFGSKADVAAMLS